jgi:hypothetical protein
MARIGLRFLIEHHITAQVRRLCPLQGVYGMVASALLNAPPKRSSLSLLFQHGRTEDGWAALSFLPQYPPH